MERTTQLLKELTCLPGIPGREEAVTRYLHQFPLNPRSSRVDGSGNAWIELDGPDSPPVVLVAHMDEVGFRVRRIEADGRLSLVGQRNTDLRTLPSEILQVWTDQGPLPAFVELGQATIGPRDDSMLKPDRLRLDLGFSSSEEARAAGVQPGNPVTYDAGFTHLAGNLCCAKALDDRSGLAAILRALELTSEGRAQRPWLLGTCQEEIGGHGADSVEFTERPGALLVLDICGAEAFELPPEDRQSIMGQGPILLDHPGTHRGLLHRLEELARAEEIPTQRLTMWGRGADPSVLQKKCGGLPMVPVILPMAYYHGPRGLIRSGDVWATARLVASALRDPELLEHAG